MTLTSARGRGLFVCFTYLLTYFVPFFSGHAVGTVNTDFSDSKFVKLRDCEN